MLSFPCSTFPTFTIGTKVGLSISTSRSSGFVSLPNTGFCALAVVSVSIMTIIAKNMKYGLFLIIAQKILCSFRGEASFCSQTCRAVLQPFLQSLLRPIPCAWHIRAPHIRRGRAGE